MNEPLVYLNGQQLPWSQARLPIYDAGIVMGATVTEMVRTFGHGLYRLDDHLRRFERSLRHVRFDLGMSMQQLGGLASELVEHNAGLIHADDDLGLAMFATAGEVAAYAGRPAGSASNSPTLCVHTFPLPFEQWADTFRDGLHLVTPAIRHVPPQCLEPNMKCRSRMHFYLADQEARLVDPRAAALLLDIDGYVTETSSANFLIVEDDRIVTPTLRNTLPGISRAVIRELAVELGIEFCERDFRAFDVVNAQEAFTATTPVCMLPVTRINGTAISDGRPGPTFRRLLDAWGGQLGVDIQRQVLEGADRRRASV